MKRFFRLSAFYLSVTAVFATAAPVSAADLTMLYNQPAAEWMQALPIGNGRIGGMVFGGLGQDQIQFNDITLWSGDENTRGTYQAFGDLYINLPGQDEGVTNYVRDLNLEYGVAQTAYTKGGVNFQRNYFASHPAEVMVFHLTASKPGSYTGNIELTDMHNGTISVDGNRITCSGNMANYTPPAGRGRGGPVKTENQELFESQVVIVNQGGKLGVVGNTITFTGCDSLTIILGAGTSYSLDYATKYQGDNPHEKLTAQMDAAAKKSSDELYAEHEKDYRALFGRVNVDLGETSAAVRALPMDQRLTAYKNGGDDPGLEAMFFQFGRYLMMSSSRDILPAKPANLPPTARSTPRKTTTAISRSSLASTPGTKSHHRRPNGLLPLKSALTRAGIMARRNGPSPGGRHSGRDYSTARTPTNDCARNSPTRPAGVQRARRRICSRIIHRSKLTATSAAPRRFARCCCKARRRTSRCCPRCRRRGPPAPSPVCGRGAASRWTRRGKMAN